MKGEAMVLVLVEIRYKILCPVVHSLMMTSVT